MPQIILRRSSVTGKIPTTSSLDFGELGINTTDGRVFLKNSGSFSSPTIQEFLITNTSGSITGSVYLSGSIYITGSLIVSESKVDFTKSSAISGSTFSGSFVGDGSNLTGVTANAGGSDTQIQFNDGGTNLAGDTNFTWLKTPNELRITGSLIVSHSIIDFTGTPSISGSKFSGSFFGDGSQLTGIVSSKWTGSNPLSRLSDVHVTGSFLVSGSSVKAAIFGDLNVTGSINASKIGSVATWLRVTASYTDVNIAEVSKSLTIYSLPAGAALHGAVTKTTASFGGSGGVTFVSMSIGVSSEKDRYANLTDVSTSNAVSDTTLGLWQNFDIQNWGSSTDIIAQFTASANLSNLTTGYEEIYLYVAQVKQ